MTTSLQTLTIPSYTPTLPIHYTIRLQLTVQTWNVSRRYSDFLSLHTHLVSTYGSLLSSATSTFPHKQPKASYLFSRLRGGIDEPAVEHRRASLQHWLNAVWRSAPQVTEDIEWKKFLEWPNQVPFSPPPPDEAKPSSSTPPTPAATATVQQAPRSAPRTNTLPGSLPPTMTRQPTRTLGQRPPPAVETATTRALDNTALYAAQQAQIETQDSQLDNLTAVLRRQRTLGETINTELQEHSELLAALDDEVQATQAKMNKAEGKMQKVEGNRAKRMWGLA